MDPEEEQNEKQGEDQQEPVEEIETFIVPASKIQHVWTNAAPREALVEILQNYFKPQSALDDEKMEYNEINILSEYQVYNLIFAKQELLLDDRLCAYFLEVMWRLLEINNDGSPSDSRVPAAEDFKHALDHKFALLRNLLLNTFSPAGPGKAKEAVFAKDQIKRILDYTRETYFKHFRLYDYVLNNKQLVEIKKLTVFQEMPIGVPQLSEALSLGKDQNELEAEEVEGDAAAAAEEEKGEEEHAAEGAEGEPAKAEGEEGVAEGAEEDNPLNGLEERLKGLNLDEDAKRMIQERLLEFNNKINTSLADRQKVLDEKLEAAKKK